MKIRILFSLSIIFIFNIFQAQEKFKVKVRYVKVWHPIYTLVNEKGKIIKQLDSSKYYHSFNDDKLRYFAVFAIKNDGNWVAINSQEQILFKVYNTSFGEPSPDELVENKIRIVDKNDKIGFADNKGKIIIKPQFEIVSSFHNGKAIIGEKCRKIPWDADAKEGDCHHYSIECENYGYINETGKIIELNKTTFEKVKKKINWKSED